MKRTLPGEIWRVDFGLAAKAAIHLQQIQPLPLVRFDVRLGALSAAEFGQLKQTLVRLLNL